MRSSTMRDEFPVDDLFAERVLTPVPRAGELQAETASEVTESGTAFPIGLTDELPFTEPGIEPAPQPHYSSDGRELTIETWECVVLTDVDANGDFDASLHPLSGALADEVGTFNVSEVPESDRHLVERGAVFYSFVGQSVDKFGQLTYVWRVRFRRLPRWTRRDLAKVDTKVNELAEALGLNANQRAVAR